MSRLNEQFIKSVTDEFSKIDFEELYNSITETKSYERITLRRYCILGIYIADDKKMGHIVQVLGHYEQLLRDNDYTLLLEEIQRIVVTLNRINKPETNVNRLYM